MSVEKREIIDVEDINLSSNIDQYDIILSSGQIDSNYYELKSTAEKGSLIYPGQIKLKSYKCKAALKSPADKMKGSDPRIDGKEECTYTVSSSDMYEYTLTVTTKTGWSLAGWEINEEKSTVGGGGAYIGGSTGNTLYVKKKCYGNIYVNPVFTSETYNVSIKSNDINYGVIKKDGKVVETIVYPYQRSDEEITIHLSVEAEPKEGYKLDPDNKYVLESSTSPATISGNSIIIKADAHENIPVKVNFTAGNYEIKKGSNVSGGPDPCVYEYKQFESQVINVPFKAAPEITGYKFSGFEATNSDWSSARSFGDPKTCEGILEIPAGTKGTINIEAKYGTIQTYDINWDYSGSGVTGGPLSYSYQEKGSQTTTAFTHREPQSEEKFLQFTATNDSQVIEPFSSVMTIPAKTSGIITVKAVFGGVDKNIVCTSNVNPASKKTFTADELPLTVSGFSYVNRTDIGKVFKNFIATNADKTKTFNITNEGVLSIPVGTDCDIHVDAVYKQCPNANSFDDIMDPGEYTIGKNGVTDKNGSVVVSYTEDTYVGVLLCGGGGGGSGSNIAVNTAGGGAGGSALVLIEPSSTNTYKLVIGKGGEGGPQNSASKASVGENGSLSYIESLSGGKYVKCFGGSGGTSHDGGGESSKGGAGGTVSDNSFEKVMGRSTGGEGGSTVVSSGSIDPKNGGKGEIKGYLCPGSSSSSYYVSLSVPGGIGHLSSGGNCGGGGGGSSPYMSTISSGKGGESTLPDPQYTEQNGGPGAGGAGRQSLLIIFGAQDYTGGNGGDGFARIYHL